jgi:hypothetical protein
MIIIVRDPRLKTTHRILSKGPATVDESFADPGDLSNVSVSWGELSVRKLKSNGGLRGIRKSAG